jgi:hypothetical protein
VFIETPQALAISEMVSIRFPEPVESASLVA